MNHGRIGMSEAGGFLFETIEKAKPEMVFYAIIE